MEKGLVLIRKQKTTVDKLRVFIDQCLRDYLLAVNFGDADFFGRMQYARTDKSRRGVLHTPDMVLDVLKDIDIFVYDNIRAIAEMFRDDQVSLQKLDQILKRVQEYCAEYPELNRFIFSMTIDEERVFKVEPRPIEKTFRLYFDELEEVGIRRDWFNAREALPAFVVNDNPLADDKNRRGIYKGGYYALVYSARAGLADDEKQWTAFHELGHLTSEMRASKMEVQMHPNVELFSVLFPLMFADNPKAYLESEIFTYLNHAKAHDYYCEAARGIANALIRVMNREQRLLDREWEIAIAKDSFAGKESVINRLKKLDAGLIKKYAREIYEDAWDAWQDQKTRKTREPRLFYLNTTEDGWYEKPAPGSGGGTKMREVCEGVKYPPRVKYTNLPKEQQKIIKDKLKMKKGKKPADVEWKDDKTGKRFVQGDDKDEDDSSFEVGGRGWLENAAQRAGSAARRFVEIFQEPSGVERVASRSGKGKPNFKALLSDNLKKLFFKYREKESKAKAVMSLELDVSGSIGGKNSAMGAAMHSSMEFYLSLLHKAGRNRPDVKFGLGAISTRYDEVLRFGDCKNQGAVVAAPETLWKKGNGGGIDTPALIAGLRKKYEMLGNVDAPKVSIVMTDGGETSGLSDEELFDLVDEFEQEYGVKLVFIGLTQAAREVSRYNRWVHIDHTPKDDELVNVLLKISETIGNGTELPAGDLVSELSIPIDNVGDGVEYSIAHTPSIGRFHEIVPTHFQPRTGETMFLPELNQSPNLKSAILNTMTDKQNEFNANALHAANYNKAKFYDQDRVFYMVVDCGINGFSDDSFRLLKELELSEQTVRVFKADEYQLLNEDNSVIFFIGKNKNDFTSMKTKAKAIFYANNFKEEVVVSSSRGREVLLNGLIWCAANQSAGKELLFEQIFNKEVLMQIPNEAYVRMLEEDIGISHFRISA